MSFCELLVYMGSCQCFIRQKQRKSKAKKELNSTNLVRSPEMSIDNEGQSMIDP